MGIFSPMLGMLSSSFRAQESLQGCAVKSAFLQDKTRTPHYQCSVRGPWHCPKFLICKPGDKRLTGKLYFTES